MRAYKKSHDPLDWVEILFGERGEEVKAHALRLMRRVQDEAFDDGYAAALEDAGCVGTNREARWTALCGFARKMSGIYEKQEEPKERERDRPSPAPGENS